MFGRLLSFLRRGLAWFSPAKWLIAAVMVVVVLVAADFQPARFYGWIMGPSGRIYVNSPGVYTRERLVNDRNDQDFWLREQLKTLDTHEIGFSVVRNNKASASIARKATPEDGGIPEEPSAPPMVATQWTPAGIPPYAPLTPDPPVSDVASGDPAEVSIPPKLSFVNSYAIRAAARDTIRQNILENLLDDRHDLTGNSVYGLKFDTTVYPGWLASGRAYVRLSITAGQSDLFNVEDAQTDEFRNLQYLVKQYYVSDLSEIEFDRANKNYNSFNLYKRWLANVRWRLNSYLLQIIEARCSCASVDCGNLGNWENEIRSAVSSVLALDSVTLVKTESLTGGTEIFQRNIGLPDPWHKFLRVTVEMPEGGGCQNRPNFLVEPVEEIVLLFPRGTKDPLYTEIEPVDDAVSAYMFTVPDAAGVLQSVYQPKYRNFSSIVRYLKSSELTRNKIQTFCQETGAEAEAKDPCTAFVSIPSGYFNFIEKVLEPDMYAYSLFPRLEATSALSGQSTDAGINLPAGGGVTGLDFGVHNNSSQDEAIVEPTAVGFTDANSSKSIELGWVIDVGTRGAPFQKSQFALISVPAWSSGLKINVKTGWLKSHSEEDPDVDEGYEVTVPIPPDYEAFDAFIGGEEAVRRPQINDQLMEDIRLTPCRGAAILIPGFRLWRSAMVTVGSEQAERITVLPNMRGIIAAWTKLPLSLKPGKATLRVWTSEGMDSLQNRITVTEPEDPRLCLDDQELRRLDDAPETPPATVVQGALDIGAAPELQTGP